MTAGRHKSVGQLPRRAISAAQLCAVLALALAATTFSTAPFAQPGNSNWCGDRPCEKHDPLRDNDEARSLLAKGDAKIAADENGDAGIAAALDYWQDAIDAGLASGAQASVTAQKRIQMYTLSCSSDEDSEANLQQALDARAPLVGTPVAQRALGSLGYNERPIDGQISVTFRSSVRKFQRDIAHSDSGDLTPHEFYLLICNAAQTARDPEAQTRLALMYCAGVGVSKSPPWTAAWLNRATSRGYARATLYLALLHGAGKPCLILNYDKADEFLLEAAQQGHPLAQQLMRLYPPSPDQAGRWRRIIAHPLVRDLLSLATWPPENIPPPQVTQRSAPPAAVQNTAARGVVKPRAKPTISAAATSTPTAVVPPPADLTPVAQPTAP